MTTSGKIRARASLRIRGLSPEKAQEILEHMAMITKVNDTARASISRIITLSMTGGYWSQSLDFHVMRELGAQARKALDAVPHKVVQEGLNISNSTAGRGEIS